MLFPNIFLMKKIPDVLFPKYATCPICLRAIKSDATIPNHCRLCGMGIEGGNQKFCCKDCEIDAKRFSKILKREGRDSGNNN